MQYHIPDALVAKAYTEFKNSPLPGIDAMASALRAIKGELANLVVDEYVVQQLLTEEALND